MKSQKKKNENCHYTPVKNRCMLHGRVFVMLFSMSHVFFSFRHGCDDQFSASGLCKHTATTAFAKSFDLEALDCVGNLEISGSGRTDIHLLCR